MWAYTSVEVRVILTESSTRPKKGDVGIMTKRRKNVVEVEQEVEQEVGTDSVEIIALSDAKALFLWNIRD